MSLCAVILLHLGIRSVHNSVNRPSVILGTAELHTHEKLSVRSALTQRHISLVALIYPASALKVLAADGAKRRRNELIRKSVVSLNVTSKRPVLHGVGGFAAFLVGAYTRCQNF